MDIESKSSRRIINVIFVETTSKRHRIDQPFLTAMLKYRPALLVAAACAGPRGMPFSIARTFSPVAGPVQHPGGEPVAIHPAVLLAEPLRELVPVRHRVVRHGGGARRHGGRGRRGQGPAAAVPHQRAGLHERLHLLHGVPDHHRLRHGLPVTGLPAGRGGAVLPERVRHDHRGLATHSETMVAESTSFRSRIDVMSVDAISIRPPISD